MRRLLLIIVLFLGSAFGQVISGQVKISGAVQFGPSQQFTACGDVFCAYNGADLIPDPPYPDFGGLQNNGAIWYDTSFLGHKNFDGTTFNNSAYLSPVYRVTDAYSKPIGLSPSTVYTAGEGGAGGRTLTNTDTSIVGIGGPTDLLCLFDTSSGHCKPIGNGIFVTTNLCVTSSFYTCGGGSSTTMASFGTMYFSPTDRNMMFIFGEGSESVTTPSSVCAYQINTSLNEVFTGPAGSYRIPTCVVEFSKGYPASYAPVLGSAGTHYNHGDYIIHKMTGSEMANGTGIWTSGMTVVAGDIVTIGTASDHSDDGLGNDCMYVAYVGGTAGSTRPSFTSSPPDNCPGGTLSDGTTVKWRGTHSMAWFLYQNTGTSGTTTGSAPISGHPDLMTTISDGANIAWMNVGPAVPNPTTGWSDMGWLSFDNTCGGYPSKYGMGMGNNTYGTAALGYNHWVGGQGSGFFVIEYDCTTNTFQQLNTITGIWTKAACSGNGWTCVPTQTTIGDLLAITNAGAVAISGQPAGTYIPLSPPAAATWCPIVLHGLRINRNGAYFQLSQQGANINTACNPIPSTFTLWRTDPTTYDADKSLQYVWHGLGHSVMTNDHMLNFGGASASGSVITILDNANPGNAPLMTTWLKPLGNADNPPGQSVPPGCYITHAGVRKSPDCTTGEVLDSHLSCAGCTTEPGGSSWTYIAGSTFNYYKGGPATNAWQNMETVYPVAPNIFSNAANYCLPGIYAGCTAPPAQSFGAPYQFTHVLNLENSITFATQFSVSQYSQDGKWLFWSTDNGGYLGSTTGTPPAYPCSGTYIGCFPVQPVPVRPSMSGEVWQSDGHAYVVGNTFGPIENTTSGVPPGGGDDTYQVIYVGTCSGIPCVTEPDTTTLNNHQPNCVVGGVNHSCWTLTSAPTALAPGDTVCEFQSGSGNFVNPSLPYSTSCATGIVSQDVGFQTQRGDVFAVRLSSSHYVSLSWTQSTGSNIVSNNVYRGTTSGGPYTKIYSSSSPVTSDNDTAVTSGTTYYYVVTAVNNSSQESSYSNEIQAVIP